MRSREPRASSAACEPSASAPAPPPPPGTPRPPGEALKQKFNWNPHAPSFVPRTQGRAHAAANVASRVSPLVSLPAEVLDVILSKLSSIRDLSSLSLGCRALRRALRATRLTIDLGQAQQQGCSGPLSPSSAAPSAIAPPPPLQTLSVRKLEHLATSWQNVVHISICHTAANDDHFELLLASLPRLESLQADHCKKLTQRIIEHLGTVPRSSGRAGAPERGRPVSQLRQVSLSRCFQLNSDSLTRLLLLTCGDSGRCALVSAVLSHLDLTDWPEAFQQQCTTHTARVCAAQAAAVAAGAPAARALVPLPAALEAGGPQGSALRVLSLQCCQGLSVAAVSVLTAAAPALEVLLLGGCLLQASKAPRVGEFGEVCRALEVVRHGARDTLKEGSTRDSGLNALDKGSTSPSRSGPAPLVFLLSKFLTLKGLSLPRTEALEPAHALTASALSTDSDVASAALLVLLALRLPQLVALEVTHVGSAPVALVRVALASGEVQRLAARAHRQRARPLRSIHIWEMTELADAAAAEATLATWQLPNGPTLLTCAAASTANLARYSALHIAAAEPNAPLVRLLLRLGAPANVRNKAGATPLFLACEAGCSEGVDALLAAGGHMWVATASGETCMYIAALRGQVEVLRRLVRRCEEVGVGWVNTSLYWDGWTPLMSSVVAGHLHVAEMLLDLAGKGARELVMARNKQGQTALHLAAYRGSIPIIRLLLRFTPRDTSTLKDKAGLTPVQVARKHSHKSAEALLARPRIYVA